MNGRNQIPTWLGIGIRIGGVLLAGVLAFATVSARVDATDLVAQENKEKIEKHEDRIDQMERTQIQTVTILKQMQVTLDQIKEDLKEHDATN